MKTFLAKGYAKRKLHTGNQSVQFDEELEVERPLFYSTPHGTRICKSPQLQYVFIALFFLPSENYVFCLFFDFAIAIIKTMTAIPENPGVDFPVPDCVP